MTYFSGRKLTSFFPSALANASRSLFLKSNMASSEDRIICSGLRSGSGGSKVGDDRELIVLSADLTLLGELIELNVLNVLTVFGNGEASGCGDLNMTAGLE